MSNKEVYPPFVRRKDSVTNVMMDVVVALIPVMTVACIQYGFTAFLVILVSVGTALLTELLFSLLINRGHSSIKDCSALVTGILLALTIGPFTPLGIVAFGSFGAILFGKLLWGGLGRNPFNPALMGREFMTIFFPTIMSSGVIYFSASEMGSQELLWFPGHFVNQLFFQPSGAMGEYSIVLLLLGGGYLLWRRRISWHIPLGVMVTFVGMLLLFSSPIIRFSLGGVFLGSIYMATDMPTSSSSPIGKIYFGAMIGVICVLCLAYNIPRGYLSYAILLMNVFASLVDRIFRPVVWGHQIEWFRLIFQSVVLTITILLCTYIVIFFHHEGGIKYLIYLFIVYTIVRFIVLEVERKREKKEGD